MAVAEEIHQYRAGFSGGRGRVGYTIYAQQSFDQNRSRHTQFGVNLTISLGRNSAVERGPFDSVSTNSDSGHQRRQRLPGEPQWVHCGRRRQFRGQGINAQRTSSAGDKTNLLGGNATYRSPYGTYAANASVGNRGRQIGLRMRTASMVAHAGGITLGPSAWPGCGPCRSQGRGRRAHRQRSRRALTAMVTPCCLR